MKTVTVSCLASSLTLCSAAMGGDPQLPMGEDGLSFRADFMFYVGDDFIADTDEPIVGLRFWGSMSDEAEPHEPMPDVPFVIRFYSSDGSLPDAMLASYEVNATETWTGGFCRGIEGFGNGSPCPGPEPLYQYEVCFEPGDPFTPTPGVEYWVVMWYDIFEGEEVFWAWHEADVAHPTGNEAVTWGMFDFVPGVVNACPGDYTALIHPYDLAFELLLDCPGGCPADVTGDQMIDVLDLLAILGAWGSCADCPEDINGDGVVDVLDLLDVLGAWGPCG